MCAGTPWLVLALLSCRPAEQAPRPAAPAPAAAPPATPPVAAPQSEREADEAAADDSRTTIVDAGTQPRQLLRYGLAPGSQREFRVEQRLTLFEADEARASVEVRAPLVIAVETVAADTYALRLELGPARVTREGAEGAIDWGGGELAEAGADARLIARARLTRSGRIRAARLVDSSPSGLISLYETLLGLDAPPDAAVGAGARWRTELWHRGAASTTTDYELLELEKDHATFRVHRQQATESDTEGMRAFGEWTVTADAWPPTGHDHAVVALPASGPRTRLSVRFAVTSSDAVHTRTSSARAP